MKRIVVLLLLMMVLLSSCASLRTTPQPEYLRSKPARVSRDDMLMMVWERSFNHPVDLTGALLSGKNDGTFRHIYEMQILDGDEVILDYATGLMWQRSGSPEKLTWMETKSYVDDLNAARFAGFDDWRVPTLEELASLLEFEKLPWQLYLSPAFDKTQWICWSSDIFDSASNVWFVFFDHGYISHTDADTKLYVRAVRSR